MRIRIRIQQLKLMRIHADPDTYLEPWGPELDPDPLARDPDPLAIDTDPRIRIRTKM